MGTVVNRAEGQRVYPQEMRDIRAGQKIYRNHDRVFSAKLIGEVAHRTIGLTVVLRDAPDGLTLSGTDEDGNQATIHLAGQRQPAQKKEAARQTICTQLAKLGNTIFACTEVLLETQDVYFLPVSQLNAGRRELVERLLQVRRANRPHLSGGVSRNTALYPQRHLTYRGNVLNAKARAFYQHHGVETIEPAAESGLDMSGRPVMTTRLCLRRELGLCRGAKTEPWVLQDEEERQYNVRFRCGPCGMEIRFPE